jgi:hypothetical protein
VKNRFNPECANRFENDVEKLTFEKYPPISPISQMEILIGLVYSISQLKIPDVKLFLYEIELS